MKTSYRRYSEEENPVPEIRQFPSAQCGFREEFVDVVWYPQAKPATTTTEEQPAGMFIMSSYPTCESIRPDGFRAGSRIEFEETFRKVQQVFGPGVLRKWAEFAKDVPESDSVTEYIAKHPDSMYVIKHLFFPYLFESLTCSLAFISKIPFLEELWGNKAIDVASDINPYNGGSDDTCQDRGIYK